VALTGGAVVAFVAVWLMWAGPNVQPGSGRKAVPVSDRPALVVLSFANLSNDPAQEYFSEGIAGDISTDLSRLGSLWVIARQTALSYKGRAVKASEVARDLGVRYVIDGSVQKAGARVRINVRLTDADSGRQLWAERFDREMGDLFAIQDEIAQRIVTTLAVTLSDEERKRLARRYTRNIEAYDLFLRGREAFLRQTPDENSRAKELLRGAIALDPNFARAHAALAMTYMDDWRFQYTQAAERGAEEALRLARRAVELDGDLPQAHTVLGYVHHFLRQPADAVREGTRAIALDPNDADAYATLAQSTAYAGDPERAIGLVATGMKLNPHYGAAYGGVLGQAYFLAGRYTEAIPVLQEAIASNPSRLLPSLLLTATYIKLGRQADAEWQAEEVLANRPDFTLARLERIHPFRTDAELEAYKALLRKAGLK
jgi:TolB-like protein